MAILRPTLVILLGVGIVVAGLLILVSLIAYIFFVESEMVSRPFPLYSFAVGIIAFVLFLVAELAVYRWVYRYQKTKQGSGSASG